MAYIVHCNICTTFDTDISADSEHTARLRGEKQGCSCSTRMLRQHRHRYWWDFRKDIADTMFHIHLKAHHHCKDPAISIHWATQNDWYLMVSNTKVHCRLRNNFVPCFQFDEFHLSIFGMISSLVTFTIKNSTSYWDSSALGGIVVRIDIYDFAREERTTKTK